MPPILLALCIASPWLVLPLVVLWRLRGTPLLERMPAAPPADPPRVSVVLPARNEAAHIEACVASLRATTWPDWELVVVNDGSTDDTGALARHAAADDARVRVIDAPPLPDGWFGKQWACHTGMQQTSGALLLFTDADTRHAPDLITRLVHAHAVRQADLISVSGTQEMVTFWERAIQPVVFALILTRFGGARAIEAARDPADVVANGQCFLITRDAYDAIGGHAAVRDTVAEDLMLAQQIVRARRRVSLVLGRDHLSTRMYDGFDAIVRGWRKNVYAGGRLAMKGGALGRVLFPLALVGFPLAIALPFVALPMLALVPTSAASLDTARIAAALATGAMLLAFAGAAVFGRTPIGRALLAPIGALAFAGICAQAIARGRAVEWKGRAYTSA
jgi:chlorobactene glucosyltransferase